MCYSMYNLVRRRTFELCDLAAGELGKAYFDHEACCIKSLVKSKGMMVPPFGGSKYERVAYWD